MTEDRNFDDIAHKFAKNIYGSDKGEIRQVIVWEDIETIMGLFKQNNEPLSILDAGGGLAQLSQKLAKQGHQITLCDISSEMLKLAEDEITRNGLRDSFTFIHSPVQLLDTHIEQKFDFIMFHAVLEWLAEPQDALDALMAHLKPGGIISVMFYNHHGLVYKNVLCGNIPHVLEGMPFRKRFKLQPQKGLVPDEVYSWLSQHSTVLGKSGIRVFSDYVGNRQNMGEYTFDELLEIERRLCRQEPYCSLGRYIHVWAQKNS